VIGRVEQCNISLCRKSIPELEGHEGLPAHEAQAVQVTFHEPSTRTSAAKSHRFST